MPSNQELLEFRVSNFNLVAAFLGGYLSLLGWVSYLLKEKFYLSEALISMVAGLAFSPHGANLIRPLEYALGDELNLASITLYFSRLVLGVQLVLAGIQLPSKYLKTEWKSLSLLLGPGMCAMWMTSSLLVWAMVPDLPFLHALAVGACVTPTDPVLSSSIVKGKFADKNIPKELQKIIIAESGANDGLGYPFLFLALYLIKYTQDQGLGTTGGAGKAMGYWFGIIWGYEIIMSVLWGGLIGWIFKEMLHWAEKRKYVDRESFLVFAVTLALFLVGTVGMVGSDDVLACFIAGNSFTWDDWFRIETEDDSFQPTIDMLLNVSIFAWYGAVCPWVLFAHNNSIPIYRLIFLGILVLLVRRLPIVLALHKQIPQIEEWRQASFVGFFGPIGVSAIFYLYTSLDFLRTIEVDGQAREDAVRLEETMTVVVWFLAMCSIIVHGLSIPIGKAGFHLPRTLSRAFSTEQSGDNDEPQPFHLRQTALSEERELESGISRLRTRTKSAKSKKGNDEDPPPRRSLFRIGGTVIKDPRPLQQPSESEQQNTRSNVDEEKAESSGGGSDISPPEKSKGGLAPPTADEDEPPRTPVERRTIRFPDEDNIAVGSGKT